MEENKYLFGSGGFLSLWVLLQILVNLFFVAGFVFIWARLRREPSEDPRLSRGLQMVSSKIAILEDLSRQTDTQSQQIYALIEQKAKQLLEQIEKSDEQIAKIEFAQQKSLEVAQIFQDKIPHEEIRHREQTMKYIEVARMAHEGKTANEIHEEIGLSLGEIELIMKLNKDNFHLQEAMLPSWTGEKRSDLASQTTSERNQLAAHDKSEQALKTLGEKFRKVPEMLEAKDKAFFDSKNFTQTGVKPKGVTKNLNLGAKNIQPVEFPRI